MRSRDPISRARRLIAVQSLAGVLAGVAVAAVVTFGVVLVGQHREINGRLNALTSAPNSVTAQLQPGSWVVSVDASGVRTASPGTPAALPRPDQVALIRGRGHAADGETYVGDDEYQTRGRLVAGTVVLAGVDIAPYESERHRLLGALALAALGAGLVAAWLGARLGRHAVSVWDEALERQRRFIADASHELRTPLSRLALRADLVHTGLRRGAEPAGLAEDVDLLRHESALLADIVEDLLHAAEVGARPEAGELVDIGDLALEVTDLNQVLAAERGLLLSASVADVPPVRGAGSALRRALDALVDNALRHGSSAVTVRVAADGDWVLVSVADDGPGLQGGRADRLFDRFARDPGSPGFGIGLALVRDVVQGHGGSVRAVPTDPGLTFEVRLPAESVEVEGTATTPPPAWSRG